MEQKAVHEPTRTISIVLLLASVLSVLSVPRPHIHGPGNHVRSTLIMRRLQLRGGSVESPPLLASNAFGWYSGADMLCGDGSSCARAREENDGIGHDEDGGESRTCLSALRGGRGVEGDEDDEEEDEEDEKHEHDGEDGEDEEVESGDDEDEDEDEDEEGGGEWEAEEASGVRIGEKSSVDSVSMYDELQGTVEESLSFHSSSESLPEQAPVNWTSSLLQKLTPCTESRKVQHTQDTDTRNMADKWFDSADSVEDKSGSEERMREERHDDDDAGQKGRVKKRRVVSTGGSEKESGERGEGGDGVVLVSPPRSVKMRPLLLPKHSSPTSTRSKYQESRIRLQSLLAQRGHDGNADIGSGDGGGGAGAVGVEDGDRSEGSNSVAEGTERKGASRSKGKVGDGRGDTVEAVLITDVSLDALISKASRGDVQAKAAVGIRILFNNEEPGLPFAEVPPPQSSSDSPWRPDLPEEEEVGRMGLPKFPIGLEDKGEEDDVGGAFEEEEEEGAFAHPELRKALEWLREAASKNVTAAQRSLGHCYLRAHGVVQNNKTAVGWIARAAKSGDSGAQFDMGRAWEEGVGVTQNMTKAVACYQKAAQDQYPDGHLWLGHVAVRGLHTPSGIPDIWAAIESYSQAAAFKSGPAWLCLGALYHKGIQGMEGGAFKTSQTMAFRCWREAAALGEVEAMYAIGVMYLQGSKVEQSDRKGFIWMRRAALGGHVDAAVAAGFLCVSGRGVTARSETRALNYFLFAADHDSPRGLVHAAQLLLLRHQREHGNTQVKEEEDAEADGEDMELSDRAHAVQFLKKATTLGEREAFFLLARTLCDGTLQQRREGQALLTGGAERGDTHAMFHCALWYLDGSWSSLQQQGEGERVGAGKRGGGRGGRTEGELGGGGAGGGVRRRGGNGGVGEVVGEGMKGEKEEAGMKESNFLAAAKFGGKKNGYTFKSGRQGLGYYRDWSQNIETTGEGGDGEAASENDKAEEGSGGESDTDESGGGEGEGGRRARAGEGYNGAIRESVNADVKLGMDWLSKAAKGKHPLAISLYNLLTLDKLSTASKNGGKSGGENGGVSLQTNGVSPSRVGGGGDRWGELFEFPAPSHEHAYLSAGRYLDLDEEAKLALAAHSSPTLAKMRRARPLVAERLLQTSPSSPLHPTAASGPVSENGGGKGGEAAEPPNVAERLASLRQSLQAVLQVAEDQMLSRVATEVGVARAVSSKGRRGRGRGGGKGGRKGGGSLLVNGGHGGAGWGTQRSESKTIDMDKVRELLEGRNAPIINKKPLRRKRTLQGAELKGEMLHASARIQL